MNYFFVPVILVAVLCGCAGKDQNSWSELPAVTQLAHLKQTDFVITMADPAENKKNIIYAPAFMMAWEKLKQQLKSEVVVRDNNSAQFKSMNSGKQHLNTLNDDEYTIDTEIDGAQITVRAFFNKTLPFTTKLHTSDSLLRFSGTTVSSFGMLSYDADIAGMATILYYENDDHFILRLSPQDSNHEIILAKGVGGFERLEEAARVVARDIDLGKRQAAAAKNAWKYHLAEEDVFAIPVLKFNIETEYQSITGEKFVTRDQKPHHIIQAYQRTGFILNENGAVVESEAAVSADSGSAAPPRPKLLLFDQPFLVMIKRVDASNPYFAMWVANTELMIRKER